MILALSSALAQPLWGQTDLDDDGIRDRDDACVRIPETKNGFMDSDGCPDQLSGITFGATTGTLIEEQATLVAMFGGQTKRSSTGMLRIDDLVPGSKVDVVAGLGCHAARGTYEIDEEYRRVRLKMQPALASDVTFLVRDPFGESVDTAKLVWLSSEPAGCSPTEDTVLERGYGKVRLGRGTHTVLVRTPNGAKTKMEVTVGAEPQDVFVDMPIPGGRDANGGRMLGDTVYFADDSAKLDEAATAVVRAVSAYLRDHPDLSRVTVEGHGDYRGWGPYNETLSVRRAQAVVDALVASGVAADRLIVDGRGEKEPADPGTTPEALAKNRRVHFIVAK